MNPFLYALGGAALVLLLYVWVRGRWRRWRQDRYFAGRSREHAERRQAREKQIEEQARLAGAIVATSSSSSIVGYRLVRQIEAVFVDGHSAPAEAVEGLKAVARLKGANAVINLATERMPSGKCAARGDAVVVQPLDGGRRAPREDKSTDARDARDARDA